ncbi:MAG TPA: NAD(P)/FAD-dependent oxidoreductase [Polyangiaceae bacterium]|nr:NAD(P)/FAD-dependent oxidoreductase [Polyangiaceae bacterium]
MRCDVAIVGGGPAGLSAALVLGRCRRTVIVLDDGRYRNEASAHVRGFITREGTPPAELRRLARAEIARYPSVSFHETRVVDATRSDAGFELTCADDAVVVARRMLLATGLVDKLPDVPGARELLGNRLFHCPYCDGWELSDMPLAAYASGDDPGARFALEMSLWSSDVVFCTDGPCTIDERYRTRLREHGIPICDQPIVRFEAAGEGLQIVFERAPALQRRALFFSVGCQQRSDLAEKLGCRMTKKGGVESGRLEATNVPGLWVAGDASRDALQAIVGAGEGSKAALAINTSLMQEDIW